MKSCEFLSMAILFKREIITAWSVRTDENCSLIFFFESETIVKRLQSLLFTEETLSVSWWLCLQSFDYG